MRAVVISAPNDDGAAGSGRHALAHIRRDRCGSNGVGYFRQRPCKSEDRNGGYDEETATNDGGWTYQTIWLIMGGDQNMDDWMHQEYGALTAEEYERVGTGHVPTHHFELVGIGKPLSCGAM